MDSSLGMYTPLGFYRRGTDGWEENNRMALCSLAMSTEYEGIGAHPRHQKRETPIHQFKCQESTCAKALSGGILSFSAAQGSGAECECSG